MKNAPVKENIVVFRVDTHFFGFWAEGIAQITHRPKLMVPPLLPPIILGFVLISHQAIPVLMLAKLFELPFQNPGLYTPLILLKTEKGILGFEVDEVIEIKPVDQRDILKIDSETLFNDCVDGTIKTKVHDIHILNTEKILIKKEKETISSFAQKIQGRLNTLEVNWY